jgi:predicted DNA-binding transcriptional regulator YafY
MGLLVIIVLVMFFLIVGVTKSGANSSRKIGSPSTNRSNSFSSSQQHASASNDLDNSRGSTNAPAHVNVETIAKISSYQNIIQATISSGGKIRIKYRSDNYYTHERESTMRVISPLSIYHDGGSAYVRAFCHLRNAERNFKLIRIQRIEDVEN